MLFSRMLVNPKSLSDQSRTGKQFGNSIVHGFTPSVHWLVSRAALHVLQDNCHFSLENKTEQVKKIELRKEIKRRQHHPMDPQKPSQFPQAKEKSQSYF